MRILFALPGLHAVKRGAEVAFIEVASGLGRLGHDVTLIGSGPPIEDQPYRYLQGRRVARERFEHFPRMPALRSPEAWEEASFVPSLLRLYRPNDYDVTLTCSYPYVNWALRRPTASGRRPPHVFVTQNGDWPAHSDASEFRLFGCEGLVCINPDYVARNKHRYRCALIPNGVDTSRFAPGSSERSRFGLPEGVPIVLMVSAMIPSKNVADGIEAVSRLSKAYLVVAGDGPLRDELSQLAARSMPGRYRQIAVAGAEMPQLYRSANVFLHMSREEPFGNAYLEALASGVPIVAYDLPRTRWIVGEEAEFAEQGPVSVADALFRAITKGAARQAARVERAASFDCRCIALSYANFLEDVVKAKPRKLSLDRWVIS